MYCKPNKSQIIPDRENDNGVVPAQESVCKLLTSILRLAQGLEECHNIIFEWLNPGVEYERYTLTKGIKKCEDRYGSRDDVEEMYAFKGDLEDTLDEMVFEEDREFIISALESRKIYSKNVSWLHKIFASYKTESLIVNKFPSGTPKAVIESYSNILMPNRIQGIADSDLDTDAMSIILSELSNDIATLYKEIENTYDTSRYLKCNADTKPVKRGRFDLGKTFEDDEDRLPDHLTVTEGFNSFCAFTGCSFREIAEFLNAKLLEYDFVPNEVDKDPEISKKIRAMVPEERTDDFELIVNTISKDEVDDILNGVRFITDEYIDAKLNSLCV